MARSEARIYTEIWEDPDFDNLETNSQGLYSFLLSQPDLAHSGVIPLRERRWARKGRDGSVEKITAGLKDLEAHFLVIDWEAEEVLIRSLIRRDRIFRQPNVLRAATDHIPLIQSLKILDALCLEMARIRVENPTLTEHQEAAMVELERALAKRVKSLGGAVAVQSTGNPTENPSEKGSDIPSGNATPEVPGERGGTKAVARTEDPPRTPSPGPRTPTPMSADALIPLASLAHLATAEAAPDSETANATPKRRRKQTPKPVSPATPEQFAEAWDIWPRPDKRQAAVESFDKARFLVEQEALLAAMRAYLAYERARGTGDKFIPYFSTWLNQKRWTDPISQPERASNVVALRGDRDARPPMRSTTDERVSGWLDIAAAAREASS